MSAPDLDIPTTASRRPALVAALVAVVAVGTMLGLDAYGRGRRVYRRAAVVGAAPVEHVAVDTPAAAYAAWRGRGLRGRTVVHVAGAWERLDTGIDAPAARAYPLRLYRPATVWERDLSAATFLYAATMNGIVRRMVIIVPAPELERLAAAARAAKNVRRRGADLDWPHQGLPRRFTTGAGFVAPREPVLLSVSASYFGRGEPDELFRELAAAGLAIDFAVLCRATDDPTVTADARRKLEEFARLLGRAP